MRDAFQIAEVGSLGDMVVLRGRALDDVSVGSKLYLRPDDGEALVVVVEQISTYGRGTGMLGAMWTGDLMVRSLEGRSMDEFVGAVARLVDPAEAAASAPGDDG